MGLKKILQQQNILEEILALWDKKVEVNFVPYGIMWNEEDGVVGLLFEGRFLLEFPRLNFVLFVVKGVDVLEAFPDLVEDLRNRLVGNRCEGEVSSQVKFPVEKLGLLKDVRVEHLVLLKGLESVVEHSPVLVDQCSEYLVVEGVDVVVDFH